MSAPLRVRPRERLFALACVALIQLALGLALVSGLRVDVGRPRELISRLIEVTLAPPPPPPVVEAPHPQRAERRQQSAAPKTKPAPPGGSLRMQSRAVAAPTSALAAKSPAPAPAGSGTGTASATGAGSGTGGQGSGDDDEGGTDLVQIAGAILPGDYPRDLRERGIGGHVGILFKVGPDGRVSGCTVTRTSGVPALDALTCRLIRQRFRYRPSTDRTGRPIADEVEGEHDWIASGR